MFQDSLNNIATHIMEYNPYFDEGHPYVWLDPLKGFVGDDNIVFPRDSKGSFFYLRVNNGVTFEYSNQYKFSDCVDGIAAREEVVLVAVVKNGSAEIVVRNMINTLRNYRTQKLTLRRAIYQKEEVVLQELAQLNEQGREAALKRLPQNSATVSVTFEMLEIALDYKLNCILDPCKC